MEPIHYRSDLAGVSAQQLSGGFFEGWAEPRTPVEHLEILRNSDLVELAIDPETGQVVGYLTALTDGVQSAFVSLLEVLPSHRERGIGSTLVRRGLSRLGEMNDGRGINVDLSCNEGLVGFYERLGMSPGRAMWIRPHLDRLRARGTTGSSGA